jgi:hypothetical protein
MLTELQLGIEDFEDPSVGPDHERYPLGQEPERSPYAESFSGLSILIAQ